MSRYEPGRSKTEDILIDQLTALESINLKTGSSESTRKLYVSLFGDNSDGLSWETSFNCPRVAALAAVNDPDEFTEIVIAPGFYDINAEDSDGIVPGNSRKLYFRGLNCEDVRIANRASGASSVFGLNAPSKIESLTVVPNHWSRGIEFNEGSDYSCVNNVSINRRDLYDWEYDLGGFVCGIQLHSVSHCRVDNIRIVGGTGETTGIELIDMTRYNDISNVRITDCRNPIMMSGTGEILHNNHFTDIIIEDNAFGGEISSGAYGNHFNRMFFENTAVHVNATESNFRDFGYNNHFSNIDVVPKLLAITPEDLLGITASTDAVAGNWGAWIEIPTPVQMFIPKQFKLGTPSANARYRLQVSRGATQRISEEEILDVNAGFFMGDGKIELKCNGNEVFEADEQLWVRIMNDNAGVDTIVVFLVSELI